MPVGTIRTVGGTARRGRLLAPIGVGSRTSLFTHPTARATQIDLFRALPTVSFSFGPKGQITPLTRPSAKQKKTLQQRLPGVF